MTLKGLLHTKTNSRRHAVNSVQQVYQQGFDPVDNSEALKTYVRYSTLDWVTFTTRAYFLYFVYKKKY